MSSRPEPSKYRFGPLKEPVRPIGHLYSRQLAAKTAAFDLTH